MSELANLRKVLAGSDFVRIGKSTADKVVDAYGEDLYEILDREDKKCLKQVTTDKKAGGLIQGWRKIVAKKEIVRWLDQYCIDPSIGSMVFGVWGGSSLDKLKSNPYRLLAMVSWDNVDALAGKLGVPPDHPVRLIGAAEQAAYTYIDEQGSTWTDDQRLKVGIAKLLGVGWDAPTNELILKATEAIELAVETQALIPVDAGFQVPGAFFTERQIENWLRRRAAFSFSLKQVSGILEQFQASEGISLSPEQRKAVENSFTNSVTVFYGGAGVGKTFVIKAICATAEMLGKTPILLALAAKAVRKMAASTGRDAMTLARALHRLKPMDFANSVIVIDEFSMVDMLDFRRLIQQLPDNAQLVLCGDAAQLPSIGPGRLLYTLIHCGELPVQELTITHRQTADTGIPRKLLSIRNGTLPALPAFEWDNPWADGIFLMPCTWKTIPRLVTKLYDCFEGETQVISPLRDGPIGVKSLNRKLHRHLTRSVELTPDTPVVFTANMTLADEAEVVNGLQGKVKTTINPNPRHPDIAYVEVETESVAITCSLREAESFLELAYVLTVHRSQGSDWETIIAVLPLCRLMERALVYTALSRCKRRCVVLAPDMGELRTAVFKPPSYETRQDRLFY